MNPYGDTNSHLHDRGSPGSLPSPDPYINSHNASLSGSSRSPPVIHTDTSPPRQTSDQHGAQSPNIPASPSPVSVPGIRSALVLVPSSFPEVEMSGTAVPNPYAALVTLRCQVSIIVPSPDLHPAGGPEEPCPDLECSICFSEFNNVFRCPKMLQCKHTFCLECLARINIKSAEPNAIQCPLCRGLTPLPVLGLPKLATDADVVSYLPAAMQRVYSIRFQRNKGKLKVKRSGV